MPESQAGTPLYSIGAISRMLSIPVATIRSWEERYAVVIPARSLGGQRVYTRDQLEQLRFLMAQVADGLTPADAHRVLSDQFGVVGPERAAGAPRLLILLAERDPYAAEIAEYLLRTEGYDVQVALEAAEAEDLADRLQPDLTVIEWLISGGVGAEVCRRVKAQSDKPVLVISGLALEELAFEAGADAFVPKPLDALQFVAAIKDLLGQSALTRPTPTPVG